MQRKHVLGLVIAAALASVGVYAQKGDFSEDTMIRGRSADLITTQSQRILSQRASQFGPQSAKSAPITTRLADPIYPVTRDDVYDVESFGRYVKWLGLAGAFIRVETGCEKPTSPDEYCQEMNPTVGATTAFNFQDAARIKLPKAASNSILCYWFSPMLRVTYNNPTASRVVGRLRYSPTLTVENPVLSDPSLIDPTTGVPFGGQLLTSMSSSESFQESLEAGATISESTRDSTVCMAGLISHRALVENYGLTPAQADDFFASPTTVRLNISGSVQYVSVASMNFGLRIVGD
jgi:hypothetical protein